MATAELTSEQQEIVATIRTFVERDVVPVASELIGFSGPPRWCGRSAWSVRPSRVVMRTPPGNAAGYVE